MGDAENPWTELVAVAEETIRRIERGDPLAARDAIRAATVGLRGVLAGGALDPEQTVYVKWLVAALNRLNPDYHVLTAMPRTPTEIQRWEWEGGRGIPTPDVQLAKEFDANKALGLVISHAPPVPAERDAVLCLWVHEELDLPRHKFVKRPTPPIFKAVAQRAVKEFGADKAPTAATIAKAWKKYAAEKRGKRT